jgi:type I restriction enzyme S subunit
LTSFPAHWVNTTLAAISKKLVDGSHNPPPKATAGLPMLSARNISGGKILFDDYRLIEESAFKVEDRRTNIEADDVLLTIVGAIGRSAVVPAGMEKFTLQRSVAVFAFENGVDPSFVSHYFQSPEVQRWLEDNAKGTAQKGIYLRALGRREVPLPPLAEQRRIVTKLDSLTARTTRARAELNHIPRLVEKYKQAILAKAFSGELTKEWRRQRSFALGTTLRAELLAARTATLAAQGRKTSKDYSDIDFGGEALCGELPTSWSWMPVEGLSTKVSDGVHKKPQYIDAGVPFVTVRNLTAESGITFDGCRFISRADHDEFSKRTPVEFGDILISKDGTLGVTRAVRTHEPFSVFVSVALVKPVDRSMTDYLELAFQSPAVQMQMVGVGSGLQHIHLTDLRKDMIPVAPAAERIEIVNRIRAAFNWLDKVAAEHARASHLVPKLDQSILAKAFRGELVPQDPSDEPASVMLANLAASERPSVKRARRQTETKG